MADRMRSWLATSRLQPAWEALERLAQMGMNVGGGADPRTSGERFVLERVAKTTKDRRVVVIDAGAHMGGWSSLALEVVPRLSLHAFEPSSTAFAELDRRLGTNPRVDLHNLALGASEGFATLHADSDGSPLASLFARRLDHFAMRCDPVEQVRVTTIDAFCDARGIDAVDLLKIDVEGAEFDVLEGARSRLGKSIRFVQFEFGGTFLDARRSLQDVFYLLADRYSMFRVLPRGLAAIERYAERHERFVTTNFLAISKENP